MRIRTIIQTIAVSTLTLFILFLCCAKGNAQHIVGADSLVDVSQVQAGLSDSSSQAWGRVSRSFDSMSAQWSSGTINSVGFTLTASTASTAIYTYTASTASTAIGYLRNNAQDTASGEITFQNKTTFFGGASGSGKIVLRFSTQAGLPVGKEAGFIVWDMDNDIFNLSDRNGLTNFSFSTGHGIVTDSLHAYASETSTLTSGFTQTAIPILPSTYFTTARYQILPVQPTAPFYEWYDVNGQSYLLSISTAGDPNGMVVVGRTNPNNLYQLMKVIGNLYATASAKAPYGEYTTLSTNTATIGRLLTLAQGTIVQSISAVTSNYTYHSVTSDVFVGTFGNGTVKIISSNSSYTGLVVYDNNGFNLIDDTNHIYAPMRFMIGYGSVTNSYHAVTSDTLQGLAPSSFGQLGTANDWTGVNSFWNHLTKFLVNSNTDVSTTTFGNSDLAKLYFLADVGNKKFMIHDNSGGALPLELDPKLIDFTQKNIIAPSLTASTVSSAHYIASDGTPGDSFGMDITTPDGTGSITVVNGLVTNHTTCVLGSTKIFTPFGLIAIRKLKVGDIVYSMDIPNGRLVENKIKRVLVHPNIKDYFNLKYQDYLTGKNEHIGITGNHHIEIFGRGMTPVDNVIANDYGMDSTDNFQTITDKVLVSHVNMTTYNLLLETTPHNYIANNLVISNKCPRLDGFYNGRWYEVGRAIYCKNGIENKGEWSFTLNTPCQYFRLVEDEQEYSHLKYIKGDGRLAVKNWKSIPYAVKYFTFKPPVTQIDTFGYYDFIK